MKTKKRILSLLLAFVMVFALSASAFAQTSSDVTVTIYVQEASRDANDAIEYTYVWTDTPIVVTVPSGSTLKTAIKAATADGTYIMDDSWDDNYGNTNTVWLSSLTINAIGAPYKNDGTYSYDVPSPGLTTWSGTSWMYFNGTPGNMPTSSYSYPSTALGSQTVTADTTITLSYEFLTYVY